MLWKQKNFILFSRELVAIFKRKISNKSKNVEIIHNPIDIPTAGYLSRCIGNFHHNWSRILSEYPELLSVKKEDIIKSAECLKSHNYTISDIMSTPPILYYSWQTLKNRHLVLRECGCEAISISLLSKYVTFINKRVDLLKSHGYIPTDVDVSERLRTCFTDVDVNIPNKMSENTELKTIRQYILNNYLKHRLQITDKDIEKLWSLYSRVRHKAFSSVQGMIDILINDLNFSTERIIKNGYVLYGDPENVQNIIKEIKTIDGKDIREILYLRPKVLMSSFNALQKTIQHIKSFNIEERCILRCLEVLTLGPDTVLDRLRDLNEIDEFKVLKTNPRILRLIHYQNKARLRLEYLNRLKVRCTSLHILSCGSDAFAKFARDGSDKTKGKDITIFLASEFKKDENSIRTFMSRHPNWCHIPVLHVKQCYDYLMSKRFTKENIQLNMHLLLYSIKRIEEKLNILYSMETFEELDFKMNINELSNNEILTLILYLIEYDYHFTGDGVWTDDQHTNAVENFNNLLPDFPESLNKTYKYGVKPSADAKARVPAIAI